MTFSRKLASFLFIPAAAFLLSAGCNHAQKPQEAENPVLPAEVTARVQKVQDKVWILDGASWELPGTTDPADRKLVTACFAELSEILPLIAGDEPSTEFRVGLRVLKDAHKQLAAAPANQPAEPIVSSGLRATERLLRSLNRTHFDNDAALSKQLEVLKNKVGDLDSSHDSMNRVYAAQALRSTASILEQMSTSLMERSGMETKPAVKADAAGQ